ncbi:hypothetical protein B0H67DRAFT_597206 [Lasiosphaeris hirsuta]|uniref:SWI5-dependent HO expression protein 3 n=1 Tax=Lasiosphaeris hirsuta TaxID=260670 RepID=A0AA40E8Z3_9PEZI|nr:hypothetical protein B0H67DRAFT_597206 [Lasiosphaeris hirsuta]
MRNRLFKARPHSTDKPAFSIHQDGGEHVSITEAAQAASQHHTPTPATTSRPSHDQPPPRPTLTPASEGTINANMSRTTANGVNGKTLPATPSYMQQAIPSRMNSTIRTVTSFDDRYQNSEDSGNERMPSLAASRNSGFSSSLNSNASMSSASQDQVQTQNGGSKVSSGARLKPSPATTHDERFLELPRTISARSSVDIPQRESSLSATASQNSMEPSPGGGPTNNENSLNAGEAHLTNGGWDSTVGKAGLGKTGRVINRLVSDNEALKRDIQIERLRAEESKQAARLLEDKLERIVSDYESRLLEANVTKTLLARKERQVETLQSSVELERKRAVDAGDRERMWKDEMEKARAESQKQVDDATNQVALTEGRYNAISSHWREQGEEVKKSVVRMRAEIASLLEERSKDDDRIGTLRDLCDQQDGNIRELRQQKEEIAAQFERYKAEQEVALRDIKIRADEREQEQERTLRESREVLDKLRWALNVKEKVEWSQ